MTVVLGLTGSIGMGKSTTARLFSEAGVPVWDADAAVHRLYERGGKAVAPVGRLCPDAVRDGAIDREALKRWIVAEPGALQRLESVVHPLVAADRMAFLSGTEADVVVLDVPLLFETGAEGTVDKVVVVTAPPEVQRARVLDRPGVSPEMFEGLLAKQMPDSEKRARADYIVHSTSIADATEAVHTILNDVRRG